MKRYVIDFLKLLFPDKEKWSTIEILGVFGVLIGLVVISYMVFGN